MRVLRLTRQILVTIGLCELIGNEEPIRTKRRQRMSFSVILTVMIAMEVTSVLYAWDHLRVDDLENSLYAAFQVAAAFCIIGSLITISYQKTKVRTVLDGFQAIVDNCKISRLRLTQTVITRFADSNSQAQGLRHKSSSFEQKNIQNTS